MTELVFDGGGWVGAILLLGAYAYVTAGHGLSSSTAYLWCNVIGCICLMADTLYCRAYPSFATNTVWMSIAAFMLLRRRRELCRHHKSGAASL